MKSIEIIKDSLIYPFNIKSYLGLLILFSASFLIIPGILALGYLFRIIYYTTGDNDGHPGFTDWMNMFRDGLIFLGMALIFVMVFYGLLWILESFLIGDVDLNLASYTIAAIYTSLFNALFVMCLAHMADEKSFTAAFEFKKIFDHIKEVGWLKYLALILFYDHLWRFNQLLDRINFSCTEFAWFGEDSNSYYDYFVGLHLFIQL